MLHKSWCCGLCLHLPVNGQQNRLKSFMSVLDLSCCCLLGFTSTNCSSAIFENEMLGKCHSRSVPSSLGSCSSLSWHLGWDIFPSPYFCLLGSCKIAFSQGGKKHLKELIPLKLLFWDGTFASSPQGVWQGNETYTWANKGVQTFPFLPIASTSCLYLHACEWCLDNITGFAWAKQWLSYVPGNCCAASFSYWLGTGTQTRPLPCWWWVSVRYLCCPLIALGHWD